MILVDIGMLGVLTTLYGELIFVDREDINVLMFLYKPDAVT